MSWLFWIFGLMTGFILGSIWAGGKYREMLARRREPENDTARTLSAMAIRARQLGLFEYATHQEEKIYRLPDEIGIPRGNSDELFDQLKIYDADFTRRMKGSP